MLLRWFVVRVGVRLRSYISLLLLEYWVLMGLGRERWRVGDADGTRITFTMLRCPETEFGFGSRVWAFRCLMHFILTFILPQCTEQTARPQDLDRAIRHAVHTRKSHSQRSEETLGSGQYS